MKSLMQVVSIIGWPSFAHGFIKGLPEDGRRATYALTILMGELSLLDSCSSGWEEILTGHGAAESPPPWAE